MTSSPAKIAANRRNARRSTGPRSAAGKARARRNAFRHGLATPASLDHVAMDRIDDLVFALTRDFPDQLELELATVGFMDRLGAQWGEPPIRPKYMSGFNRSMQHGT